MRFCGLSSWKKGWKVYDVATGEIFVSRDVIFHENEFPYNVARVSDNNDGAANEVRNHNVGVDDEFLSDMEYILEDGGDAGAAALDSPAPPNPPCAATRCTGALSSPSDAGSVLGSVPAEVTPRNDEAPPPPTPSIEHISDSSLPIGFRTRVERPTHSRLASRLCRTYSTTFGSIY